MKQNVLIPMIALGLAVVPLASAKTYNITLDTTAKAGTQVLAPGQYKVKIEGANAVLTNADTGRHFTLPVKVKKADKKFAYTAVETNSSGGSDHLSAIELGGSNTELDLGD